MSKATTLHFLNTFLSSFKVGYHCKPPGSGVPVEGAMEGSKASKSIVIYTLPVTFSNTSLIQFSLLAISWAKKTLLWGKYCFSSASIERIPTCTSLCFWLASNTAQAWLFLEPWNSGRKSVCASNCRTVNCLYSSPTALMEPIETECSPPIRVKSFSLSLISSLVLL